MIERIALKNFTAFNDLKLELSPKLNVIIGENGTGKTQILKALYFANKSLAQQEVKADELLRLFRPLSGSLKGLVGEDGKSKAELKCELALGQTISINFSANSQKLAQEKFVVTPTVGSPNLIPVKEVLSLMKGILAIKSHPETLALLFDQSYLDVAKSLATAPDAAAGEKIDQDPRFSAIYLKLVELLGGRFDVTEAASEPVVAFKAGHYERVKDIQSENHGQLTFRVKRSDSADMTAEGLRKLGTLQLLLENHELNPGRSGVLIWDEPEANLNPKLMKLVVELLLELTRNGQQVVVATHDYVLLKWFDLLMEEGKGDHVRFHSLYRDAETSEINVASTDDYLEITPNPIDEAFGFLINQEIENDMGGLGK
ncbi:AAA family ATPase [Aeromonas bestiarum]|uniref:AAA family ATPase n=1 Tax=Aeromonas bestiarum TaxID=105751 RepID=UPI0005B8EF2E|nr:AAA family ATPase [Aeromonas bestiarum]